LNMNLPPFLEPWPEQTDASSEILYSRATFNHAGLHEDDPAEVLYWPPSSEDTDPRPNDQPHTVLLFVPGNPGLVDFYIPYLSALQRRYGSPASNQKALKLTIIAKAHCGHSPALFASGRIQNLRETRTSLHAQIDSVAQIYDAIRQYYSPSSTDSVHDSGPRRTRIILAGHSVGAWIALQLLKRRPDVDALFLLFPTISNIGGTPNGRMLSWLFNSPFPAIISRLSPVTHLVSDGVLQYLFQPWPTSQIAVLRSLISSPSTIRSTLSMAHEEMSLIKPLDESSSDRHLLAQFADRMYFYFAEKDNWVGKEREVIVKVLERTGHFLEDMEIRIMHGQEGVPHSFCITHSDILAEQCTLWLLDSLSR